MSKLELYPYQEGILGLLREINETAGRFADRVDHSRIPATSLWTKNQQPGIPPSVAEQA